MKIRIPAALLAASVALLLARLPADAKEFYVGEPIVKNEMQLVPHYLLGIEMAPMSTTTIRLRAKSSQSSGLMARYSTGTPSSEHNQSFNGSAARGEPGNVLLPIVPQIFCWLRCKETAPS